MAISVTKASFEQISKRFALLWRIPRYFVFIFRIVKIDFIVRHIKVSTENDGFTSILFKLLQIGMEIRIPFIDSIVEAYETLTCVWDISCH